MTDMIKKNLELAGLVVSVIGGLAGMAGLIGAFVILPYRVEAMERKWVALENIRSLDHDLLIELRERLISVQHILDHKP